MKRLVVFDLDGTLAESKSPVDGEMGRLLDGLLHLASVAVISGGNWPQFEKQVLPNIPTDAPLARLSLLPTCGTKFYQFQQGWHELYAENFTGAQKEKILEALRKVIAESPKVGKTWGETIDDRGTQITYSALGQEAPLEAKSGWDPDFSKRKKLKEELDNLIPEFSVRLGGTTSIDITKPGIDKAYGIRKLEEILKIPIGEMIFIGDAIFPGGNDYAAKTAGVDSIEVKGPDVTKSVVQGLIFSLTPDGKVAQD